MNALRTLVTPVRRMSMMRWHDPFDHILRRPSRLLDQRFGMNLHPDDFFSPLIPQEIYKMLFSPAVYMRPWRSLESQQDHGSTISCDKDKFQVNLDVQQFKPEEISVKVSDDNVLIIEGKHEEKQDEHGVISRHFVRKYALPEGHDLDKIESSLSSDGVLTITAPRVPVEDTARSIPISRTGKPIKAIENNPEQEKKDEKK